jgi:hypothetical protein
MWRALTTMAFIGRSQSLHEESIASSHYECPQTRNPIVGADFRVWRVAACGDPISGVDPNWTVANCRFGAGHPPRLSRR